MYVSNFVHILIAHSRASRSADCTTPPKQSKQPRSLAGTTAPSIPGRSTRPHQMSSARASATSSSHPRRSVRVCTRPLERQKSTQI